VQDAHPSVSRALSLSLMKMWGLLSLLAVAIWFMLKLIDGLQYY